MSNNNFCSYIPNSHIRENVKKNNILRHARKKKKIPRRRNILNEKITAKANDSPRVHPTKIDIGTYNIFYIDSQIKEILSSNISSVSELYDDLSRMIWIITNDADPIQQISAKNQAELLRKRIRDLESTLELTLYIFRTSGLIEEYRSLLGKMGAKSFIHNSTLAYKKNQSNLEEIVSRYVRIAREYITIENYSRKKAEMRCPSCDCTEMTHDKTDATLYICKECQTGVEVKDHSPSYKDTDRVNLSSKYVYTCKGHFIDAVKRFQGIQNTDPKKIQNVISIINEQAAFHNLVIEQGASNSLTKDHIYLFMAEQSLSSHYEDLNLIYHIITGEQCPNLGHIINQLYEDFDKLEEVLGGLLKGKRVNSLNVNYKLYKLLQHNSYPCKKEDFYILKTKTKEDEHNFIMKQVFEMLEWEWV